MAAETTAAAPSSLLQRLKDIEGKAKSLLQGDEFNAWMRQQPAPVEVGITTVIHAAQGAALGGLMGLLSGDVRNASFPSSPASTQGLNPQLMASFQQAQVKKTFCSLRLFFFHIRL